MTQIGLIYPHQLFLNHPVLAENRKILLLEDPLFFYDQQARIKFHKLKLVLHRASMKQFFESQLKDYDASYIDYAQLKQANSLSQLLKTHQADEIHVVDPVDDWLKQRISKTVDSLDLKLSWHKTPNFLTSSQEIQDYFQDKKRYYQHYFYQWQRKRLNLLVDEQGKPEGGQWSYDQENRQKLPDKIDLPGLMELDSSSEFVAEAKEYVQSNFSDHPGQIGWFGYPTNHHQAQDWWQDFLNRKLAQFGPYEDAIDQDHPFLFHSLISSLLNIGLLNPQQIVEDLIKHYQDHKIPLNSVEGFLRQIIGWREFMRAVYLLIGPKQRASNNLSHQRELSAAWYKGQTGLEPVDDTIKRLQKYAYCHHIERLMVLGNAMFLSQVDPKQVYRWFMEMFIDAYDWVMVPNVYGMSQYADGGQIVTKPYISGSNYLLKMSNYQSKDWSQIWDGLFWNFVQLHQEMLKKEARMGFMVSTWNRFSQDKQNKLIKSAEDFIDSKTLD